MNATQLPDCQSMIDREYTRLAIHPPVRRSLLSRARSAVSGILAWFKLCALILFVVLWTYIGLVVLIGAARGAAHELHMEAIRVEQAFGGK